MTNNLLIKNPFCSQEFFDALLKSDSIGEDSGWIPKTFVANNTKMNTYIKSHSYGEYIFDWDWANFYHQNGLDYYPKLLSMTPFTPVTVSHFDGSDHDSVMSEFEHFYEGYQFSSAHFLFITKFEVDLLRKYGYIIRESFQYHFKNNNYNKFEDFLSDLKSNKSKNIRKERKSCETLSFKKLSGNELTCGHAREMYSFYRSTIEKKGAIAYLTQDFFTRVFQTMNESILYVQAVRDDTTIAGSLFFYSKQTLYGRYWGADEFHSNLHFEMCYYQGIEFCIDNNIESFEAGAQGEHKIPRGFVPTKTYSAHKFKIKAFHDAISDYIEQEKVLNKKAIEQLSERLPYK